MRVELKLLPDGTINVFELPERARIACLRPGDDQYIIDTLGSTRRLLDGTADRIAEDLAATITPAEARSIVGWPTPAPTA